MLHLVQRHSGRFPYSAHPLSVPIFFSFSLFSIVSPKANFSMGKLVRWASVVNKGWYLAGSLSAALRYSYLTSEIFVTFRNLTFLDAASVRVGFDGFIRPN